MTTELHVDAVVGAVDGTDATRKHAPVGSRDERHAPWVEVISRVRDDRSAARLNRSREG